MGRAASHKPVRLPEKLLEVRRQFGLSQNEMIRRMGLGDELTQAEISAFERGVRTPPLHVLLAYAEAANIYMEALIKDTVDLPEKLPSRKKHEGVERATLSRRKH